MEKWRYLNQENDDGISEQGKQDFSHGEFGVKTLIQAFTSTAPNLRNYNIKIEKAPPRWGVFCSLDII